MGKHYCPKNGFQSDRFRFCDFFYVCCFHLSHLGVRVGHCEIGLNRRETCQFECFIASFNLFKVLHGSFQNKYWHMLTFPTGKYRLILYYPGRTFHFPRATGKRNSRPLLIWSHIHALKLLCHIAVLVCFLPFHQYLIQFSNEVNRFKHLGMYWSMYNMNIRIYQISKNYFIIFNFVCHITALQ